MRPMLSLLAVALLATACKPEEPKPAPTGAALAPVAAAAASAAPSAPPAMPVASARSVEEENELYVFEYSYPVAAAVIPDLKARFDAEIDTIRQELKAGAQEMQAEAKKGGWEYRQLGRWVDWKVVTDLPGWLSLSGSISTYEGGAHPNHGFESLVWDKQANRAREAAELFVGKERLSAAIRPAFCCLLDRERTKRRGEPVRRDDMFGECIDPLESTLILGSSNGKAFDRLGILVPPYAAGPYAEGEYEVTLPVTPAVLALVKPEFRPAFVVGR